MRIPTTGYPKKSLGQNFLQDENIARKIVASLSLKEDDYVLEIGPGTGILTKYIIQNVNLFVAVEIDKNLAQQLRIQFSAKPKFILYQDDVLKISFEDILKDSQSWKVVANLPYHITSSLLFKLFDHRRLFNTAVLMMQKEVAERMVAEPDSKTYGILAVFSQLYADVEKLFDVSRNVFFPKPEITSAVIRLNFKDTILLNQQEEILFGKIVKGVFNQRRKILKNSLTATFGSHFEVDQLNFNLGQRPEQISVSSFIDLTRQIHAIQSKKLVG